MKIRNDLKDWQIAQEMFGKNTQWHCKLVKTLRKHAKFENLCEDYSIVTDERMSDDCGWIIPNACLE